jgi:carbamoyltransferase
MKKLLSLRLCSHDSNISYYDGINFYYYKSERNFQIKHHAFNNLWQWRDVIKNVWNIDYKDIDEIAIIFEPETHNLPKSDIFPAIEYDLFPAHCKVWKIDHHFAHALSGWMLYDHEPSISIVIDGCGDSYSDIHWSVFKNSQLLNRGDFKKSDSIGRLMVDLGDFLGIKRSDLAPPSDGLDTAGKVMSLQSYGKVDLNFLKILDRFNFYTIDHIFHLPYWINYKEDERLAQHTSLDWASTVHHKVGLSIVDFFDEYCGKNDQIFYSGGVAQNIVWNTQIKNNFKNLIIAPHCGDEGLSLGGIEWLRKKNNLPKIKVEKFPYLQSDLSCEFPTTNTIKKAAKILSEGKILAWYQENGEIGPRALGNRSILMDPRIIDGKNKINKIKKRENYRPFGCSVLEQYKENYFDMKFTDPYMHYTAVVTDKHLTSITHVDNTSRVQTVTEKNGIFFLLLTEFYEITNCAVLLNTSLNVNGKPIVGHPSDILDFFKSSNIDCLIIGNEIYEK